jgi:putative ABC transport system permease protein
MDTFRQDVQYAIRRLVKGSGFTAIALVTLALGIGANSAIFSVVNAVLLRPLPYPQSEELVGVYHVWKGRRAVMSPMNFLDVKAQSRTIADMAAFNSGRYNLTGSGEPTQIDGAEVSASFFDVLRVRPLAGRTFHADENQPGRNTVVVLSHGLWQQRFGGDPKIVGRRITLDGRQITVVGVMPPGFSYPDKREIWLPLEYDEVFTTKARGAWYLTVIGRLAPGATVAQATAEVQTIGRRLEQQYHADNADLEMTAVSLHEATVGPIRPALMVLLGAVGFVLLIACANVANLLLARAAARESEMAVRTALGASRARLVRQLLTEAVILSLFGGVLGLLVATWGADVLVALEPQGVPRLGEVGIDRSVIAFTGGVALLTGLLFGLVPALQATGAGLGGTLKEGGRGGIGSSGRARVRGALVVAEMALAVMLLAGAGLLLKSFVRLQQVDPGFRFDDRLVFRVGLPDVAYAEAPKRVVFFESLLERVRALPGVSSAGAVVGVPLGGLSFVLTFDVEGRPPARPGEEPTMQIRVATPDYFRTMGIPLRRGRLFTAADRAGSQEVVMLSETAARRFFPDEDPLGKVIRLGWGRGEGKPNVGGTVVGIVGDVKQLGLDEESQPELYVPYAQQPVGAMDVVLRTAVPPASLAGVVGRQVHALDPNIPVSSIRPMEQIVAASVSTRRFYMLLLSVFAAVALLLAAVGIFGVMSYAVVQRTREIGIRIALGARDGQVVGMVVRQAMFLALVGVGAGTVAALVLARTLEGLLFDLSPTDPPTFAGVAALLTIVALTASYLPARRAASVDPMIALRAE